MKQLIVVAFLLNVGVVPISQSTRQPGTGVAKEKSGASAQLATDTPDKKQNAEIDAIKSIAAAIAEENQERATKGQQEAAVEQQNTQAEWQNVRAERWLVWIGLAQTLALIGTLGAIIYQAFETKEAANAAADSAEVIKRQGEIMERQTAALIRSERAWVDGDLVRKEVIGVVRDDLEIKNLGKTPAHIVQYEIRYGATRANGTWDYGSLEGRYRCNDQFFVPGDRKPIKVGEFYFAKMFSGLTNSPAGMQRGMICIEIRYDDIIEEKDPEDGPQNAGTHRLFFAYKYDMTFDIVERVHIFTTYA